jgi:hypothetical protein
VVLWRPDVGKYTAHLQKQAAPGSAPLPGASCNVIPKVSSFVGYLTGGALQAWQADPFNRGSFYFTAGGDASVSDGQRYMGHEWRCTGRACAAKPNQSHAPAPSFVRAFNHVDSSTASSGRAALTRADVCSACMRRCA